MKRKLRKHWSWDSAKGTTHQICKDELDKYGGHGKCCTCWSHGCDSDLFADEKIEAPMGVSQWRDHGIKYGYDKYYGIVWSVQIINQPTNAPQKE